MKDLTFIGTEYNSSTSSTIIKETPTGAVLSMNGNDIKVDLDPVSRRSFEEDFNTSDNIIIKGEFYKQLKTSLDYSSFLLSDTHTLGFSSFISGNVRWSSLFSKNQDLSGETEGIEEYDKNLQSGSINPSLKSTGFLGNVLVLLTSYGDIHPLEGDLRQFKRSAHKDFVNPNDPDTYLDYTGRVFYVDSEILEREIRGEVYYTYSYRRIKIRPVQFSEFKAQGTLHHFNNLGFRLKNLKSNNSLLLRTVNSTSVDSRRTLAEGFLPMGDNFQRKRELPTKLSPRVEKVITVDVNKYMHSHYIDVPFNPYLDLTFSGYVELSSPDGSSSSLTPFRFTLRRNQNTLPTLDFLPIGVSGSKSHGLSIKVLRFPQLNKITFSLHSHGGDLNHRIRFTNLQLTLKDGI